MKKRFISVIMVLCLLLSLGSVCAMADDNGSIYNKTKGTYYSTLAAAYSAASTGDTIYVASDYTLDSSITIAKRVTLVVPTSAAMNDTTGGSNAYGSVTDGTAYATLTIPNGVTLTINSGATLLVAGNQQSITKNSGCLTGNYGAIALDGSIVVKGSLYARGKITGSGTVIANSGSSVYQLLQIRDWRGGNAALTSYNNGVFPFSRYEFNNIEATAVYNYGSSLYAQYYIYAATTGVSSSGTVNVVGTNGLFSLAASGQNVTTEYSGGKLNITVNGAATTGDISMSIKFVLLSYSVSSSGMVLPFGYNVNVVIPGGSSLTVTNKLKLMPGCVMTNNGTLTVSSSGALYVYGANGYSSSYTYGGWSGASAQATVTGSGTFVHAGIVASTDSTLSNTPLSASGGTTTIKEFKQSGNSGSTETVGFFLAA